MARRKKPDAEDSSLCAQDLTDPTERKIMATAMKQGEEQITIVREAKALESQEDQE